MFPSPVRQAIPPTGRGLGLPLPLVGIALLFALGSASSAGPAKMYRWVDDSGVVHYTDQIPPQQAERGHAALSDQGLQVEVVPPAQSVEEFQREQELERLRRQQERLIEQQKASDRMLLRTFRSLDDLLMAGDGKLAAVDVGIRVARENIRRHLDRQRKLRGEAADLERAGKPVPAELTDGIAKAEGQIREGYVAIVEQERKKDAMRQELADDINRFKQLKNLPADPQNLPPEVPLMALRNLVTCPNTTQCDRYWARAVAFAQAQATMPMQTSSPTLLITAPPETTEDLSLTLSRNPEPEGGAVIFLDLLCKNQNKADTGCSTERALSARDGFRDAVTGQMAGDVMPPADAAR